jgi:hypothetical protein
MTLIEMLRANGSWEADAAASKLQSQADRIKKLEAALARIAKYDTQAIAMDALRPGERIREKKDD